jgi:hypothetical protein
VQLAVTLVHAIEKSVSVPYGMTRPGVPCAALIIIWEPAPNPPTDDVVKPAVSVSEDAPLDASGDKAALTLPTEEAPIATLPAVSASAQKLLSGHDTEAIGIELTG